MGDADVKVTDAGILDRVERLAFQAGVLSGGGKVAPKEEHPILKKIRAIGIANASMVPDGVVLYGPTPESNITWGEIVAYSKI